MYRLLFIVFVLLVIVILTQASTSHRMGLEVCTDSPTNSPEHGLPNLEKSLIPTRTKYFRVFHMGQYRPF